MNEWICMFLVKCNNKEEEVSLQGHRGDSKMVVCPRGLMDKASAS